MTYSQSQAMVEAAAGTGTANYYRLNSVYDPDASGVGTTATGYSTWAALFLNYRVNKVTIRLRGIATGATGGAVVVGATPVPGQAVMPTNPVTWRSARGSEHSLITPSDQGGKNHYTLTKTYGSAELAKWLGVSTAQYATEADFSGQIGSNPARQLYYAVFVTAVNGSTPARLIWTIDITYEVEWFNPAVFQL